MTPSDIRHAISDALARQALHELKHIQIGVDAGVVTLSGTVRSWAERRAIIGTVSAMRGVVGVQDRLTIDRTM
jgi:osmotically-inducible protein OsmY